MPVLDSNRSVSLKQVGFKFGRWLDVLYMELLVSEANPSVGPDKVENS